jgi:hypothetical protein
MYLLTTTALPTLLEWRARPNGDRLGRLLTPRHTSRALETQELGIPWAVDNDGFSRQDWPWRPADGDEPVDDYERMLYDLRGLRPLFVTCPDEWKNTERTFELWQEWAPMILRYGLPPALCLQDGMTADDIPWGVVSALFLGGSDEYRATPEVHRIFRLARENHRRIHLHVGRISGMERIEWASRLGAHSVDGTKWARFRDVHLPNGALAAAAATRERTAPALFEDAPEPPTEALVLLRAAYDRHLHDRACKEPGAASGRRGVSELKSLRVGQRWRVPRIACDVVVVARDGIVTVSGGAPGQRIAWTHRLGPGPGWELVRAEGLGRCEYEDCDDTQVFLASYDDWRGVHHEDRVCQWHRVHGYDDDVDFTLLP